MSSSAVDAEPAVKKSTHRTEVVPVVLEPHPDADSLSIVRVWGYDCVVKTADWQGIGKAFYVVPDSCVDTRRPEFAFLAADAKTDGIARVKARRLRGVVSYGLLVPAPPEAGVGEDWSDRLGVTRYEPPEPDEAGGTNKVYFGGQTEDGPDVPTGPTKYDVEAFERYHDAFQFGEWAHLHEKADGSNLRAVWWGGRLWVKTRNNWVRRQPDLSHVTPDLLRAKGVPDDKLESALASFQKRAGQVNSFWEAVERTPNLVEYLRNNPGVVVFAELAGNTNRLKYGFPDVNRVLAFDLLREGRFVDIADAEKELLDAGVPFVPCVAAGPYDFQWVKGASTGPTTIPDAKKGVIREGVVVRPARERSDRRIGRVVLKCVNPDFLAGK